MKGFIVLTVDDEGKVKVSGVEGGFTPIDIMAMVNLLTELVLSQTKDE